MTREEEIKQAIEHNLDVSIYTPKDGEILKEAFYIGAKWADSNPNTSLLWHKASEEPKIGSNIVVIDKLGQWWIIQPYNGDYNGCKLKGWSCCVHNYNDIQKWAYIEDLLSKE